MEWPMLLYSFVARSDHWLGCALRRLYRGVQELTIPAPRWLFRPLLMLFLLVRAVSHFVRRVFIAEPFFKAYCTSYGRRVRTGIFLHWIQGRGRLVVGDDVRVDGKCSIKFASQFTEHPTLTIGDGTGIGHHCVFIVGKAISIGRNCRIAQNVRMFDSSGHPSDPADRLAGAPPHPDEVRPITVHDNVWIGHGSMIFPGVTLHEGSVVAAGSVVTSDVPAATLVAGNPARKVRTLAVRDETQQPTLSRLQERSSPADDMLAATGPPARNGTAPHSAE
jgi:acetyltransferase-like isoleucine patch superfamily enzyme